jgi:hypothetical protein
MIPSLATGNGLVPILFKYDNNFAGVQKTFDGTTSHSTKRANNARQVAGYGRAPVGAGHARDQEARGQDPLLQIMLFLMQIGIIRRCISYL